MKNKKRRPISAEEKVTVLREHLLEAKAVSDVCDHHGISPVLFYRWQKEFFDRGPLVFQSERNSLQRSLQNQVATLMAKLTQKNEVLSELLEEHIRLKKTLGVL